MNAVFLTKPILLLIAANVFMNIAWYWHLRFKSMPLWQAILASWGIAFFEYCLQVPANRLGYGPLKAVDLKLLQEVITLSVFLVFAFIYLGETPRWNHLAAFALLLGAVYLGFMPSQSH